MDFTNTMISSVIGVNIIYKRAIKCEKFIVYTNGENNLLYYSDAEAWKYSYRTGLETLVVYTANNEY